MNDEIWDYISMLYKQGALGSGLYPPGKHFKWELGFEVQMRLLSESITTLGEIPDPEEQIYLFGIPVEINHECPQAIKLWRLVGGNNGAKTN